MKVCIKFGFQIVKEHLLPLQLLVSFPDNLQHQFPSFSADIRPRRKAATKLNHWIGARTNIFWVSRTATRESFNWRFVDQKWTLKKSTASPPALQPPSPLCAGNSNYPTSPHSCWHPHKPHLQHGRGQNEPLEAKSSNLELRGQLRSGDPRNVMLYQKVRRGRLLYCVI